MAWKIVDGRPTKVEVTVGLSPAEVKPAQIEVEVSELVCPHCGKEYKTERGLENHLDTH